MNRVGDCNCAICREIRVTERAELWINIIAVVFVILFVIGALMYMVEDKTTITDANVDNTAQQDERYDYAKLQWEI
jgi:hypothetical protein